MLKDMLPEVAATPFPDIRLNRRLQRIIDQLAATPTASIPQATGQAHYEATYDFLSNERVTHEAIVDGQRSATLDRIVRSGSKRILLLEDTTSFNFKHHPQTEGLGPLENAHTQGFFAHTTLAATSAGVPMGVMDQQVWIRDAAETGKSQQRHDRAFEDKESYKWVAGLAEIRNPLDEAGIEIVTVADRESHIYEFIDEVRNRDQQVIVRAMTGRSFTVDGIDIVTAIHQAPVGDTYTVQLKRRPDRDARDAEVTLRWQTLELRRPQRVEHARETLALQVVEVSEPHPPAGETPVNWVLLTTLPVNDLDAARAIVTAYTQRWLIERFHYVLKSGCRMEERQLRTANRLITLLAVFNHIAWQLLWMTYHARVHPDQDCLGMLEMDEWQALYAFTHQTSEPPSSPPTVYEAVRWIAMLGGYLGRKHDGPPGVKVLWRGWTRLQDIVVTWRLSHPPPKDNPNA